MSKSETDLQHAASFESRLTQHLRVQLGTWPPTEPVVVTTSAARSTPGWDGIVRDVAAIATPLRAVVSLTPAAMTRALARPVGAPLEEWLPAVTGRPGSRVVKTVFRWSTRPVASADVGTWVPASDGRLPAWLQAFGGDVLVAFTDRGDYAAGVGIKRHDRHGQELAVGTESSARGRGLARQLVAQAARVVLDAGAVPTYLHEPDNAASARVADAAGFADRGWRSLELS